MATLGARRVRQRLASVLLDLARRSGVPAETGRWHVAVPLGRQDLADLCGTTVESAIRGMRAFEREGLVGSADVGLIIEDEVALRAVL